MNVWTGGTFDLFHPGHVLLLRECSHHGRVTVAVNTDQFVARFKDKLPVQNLQERLTMVEACRFVDDVQVNHGGDLQAGLILRARTDMIVIGDDWKDRDYVGQLGITEDWLKEFRIEVLYVTRDPRWSSSGLKAAVCG